MAGTRARSHLIEILERIASNDAFVEVYDSQILHALESDLTIKPDTVTTLDIEPQTSHLRVLQTWIVNRLWKGKSKEWSICQNVSLVLSCLKTQLWLCVDADALTPVIDMLLALKVDGHETTSSEFIAKDATLRTLQEIVDDREYSVMLTTWAKQRLGLQKDVSNVVEKPQNTKTCETTSDSSKSCLLLLQQWLEWASTTTPHTSSSPPHTSSSSPHTSLDDVTHKLAHEVDWSLISLMYECCATVELYRDCQPASLNAVFQLLYQLRVLPPSLMFEDVLSPFCKHLINDVIPQSASDCTLYLSQLSHNEFEQIPNLPNPLLYLGDDGHPSKTVARGATLTFALLPAANRKLVVDELLQLSKSCPQRFLPTIATACALGFHQIFAVKDKKRTLTARTQIVDGWRELQNQQGAVGVTFCRLARAIGKYDIIHVERTSNFIDTDTTTIPSGINVDVDVAVEAGVEVEVEVDGATHVQ